MANPLPFYDARFPYPVMYARNKQTKKVALIKAGLFDPLTWEAVNKSEGAKKEGKKESVTVKPANKEKVKSEPEVTTTLAVNYAEMPEKELRAIAKEKGIKSWHVKNLENLRKELLLLED